MINDQGLLFRPAGSLATGDDPIRLAPEEAGWDWCGVMVVELSPGKSRRIELAEAEAAVVPLQGSCRVSDGRTRFDLKGRPDVFSANTDLCFIARGSPIRLIALGSE